MALKKFRPTSPGKRFQTVSTFEEISNPRRDLEGETVMEGSRLGIEEGVTKRCIA